MNIINKLQPLIILFAAILGLALGISTPLGKVSIQFVEIFLMCMLFIVFLYIDMKQLKKATLNIKYTGTSVIINFIITPCIAYILGWIFFENAVEIRIGLLMLLVTPCTDWYLVFTKLSKGNVELNMSILPLNLLLQVILLPVYLLLFLGSVVDIDVYAILHSIVIVLVIPFACAIIFRRFMVNNDNIKGFIADQGDNLQLLFLCMAVVVMFASESENLFKNYLLLLKLFVPLACFFIITFFVSKVAGKVLHLSREDTISLHFTTLARNSPLALAIAVASFPAEPLIALALVIGPLLELPILSMVSGILRKR